MTWWVIKIGGELARDRWKLASSLGAAVREFLKRGVRVAVVHGGGPQANELSKQLGIETRQVGGRRVTDSATLEVMKMTLAGQVSVDVASAFRLAGVPALCTTGVSSGLVEAKRRPPMNLTRRDCSWFVRTGPRRGSWSRRRASVSLSVNPWARLL